MKQPYPVHQKCKKSSTLQILNALTYEPAGSVLPTNCIIFVVVNQQKFYTMRILLVYLMLVVGITMLALGSSRGRANVARQGNTGAPGDNRAICKNCHAGSSIVVDMDIWLLDEDGNRVYSYVPEREYTVQVRIEPKKGNPRAFGFQMVCLDAPPGVNGNDIKNWLPDTNNIYQISDANNGRTYVEHRRPIRNDGIINVRWKAPPAGTDTVTFYAAGNGVNLNGNTQGDGADTTQTFPAIPIYPLPLGQKERIQPSSPQVLTSRHKYSA